MDSALVRQTVSTFRFLDIMHEYADSFLTTAAKGLVKDGGGAFLNAVNAYLNQLQSAILLCCKATGGRAIRRNWRYLGSKPRGHDCFSIKATAKLRSTSLMRALSL